MATTSDNRDSIILSLLASYTGIHIVDNASHVVLEDMGLDSLQAVELSATLRQQFDAAISPDTLLICTLPQILQLLITPLDALAQANFQKFAEIRGYTNYWTDVAPLFDELLLAYVLEAFSEYNVDLATTPEGSVIADVHHLPAYDKLFERLWAFLVRKNLALELNDQYARTNTPIQIRHSAQLNTALRERFPQYSPEASLLNLVGPNLAQCTSGKKNPVAVMFGNLTALQIMEDFYANSPMMSTLTDQLLDFLGSFIRSKNAHKHKTFRILEIGAGTGGTTTRVAKMLHGIGYPIQYVFTDISASFVSQAKRNFAQYPWMSFDTLNLEKELDHQWRGQFDVVIGANVVHATSDRTTTCRRLRTALREGGFLVLSEITRVVNWYDICFGLLDGWWLAEGGKGYPIQSAEAWMTTFKNAGFTQMGFSYGETPEANSQQLLVGCTY